MEGIERRGGAKFKLENFLIKNKHIINEKTALESNSKVSLFGVHLMYFQ